jgi:hypothetical protein
MLPPPAGEAGRVPARRPPGLTLVGGPCLSGGGRLLFSCIVRDSQGYPHPAECPHVDHNVVVRAAPVVDSGRGRPGQHGAGSRGGNSDDKRWDDKRWAPTRPMSGNDHGSG